MEPFAEVHKADVSVNDNKGSADSLSTTVSTLLGLLTEFFSSPAVGVGGGVVDGVWLGSSPRLLLPSLESWSYS